MKKLMVLGGSENQLSLIQKAEKMGYYIVLCDYAKDNVGRKHANTFYCVSTLDKDAVLEAARKEAIHGIVTNSEPAMPIAAYVGNALGLPSNPYSSVLTLSRKDLFRKFLRDNDFACPGSVDVANYDDAMGSIDGLAFPLMVKPVDSSGSRGVNRIHSIKELGRAFDEAIEFSRAGRVMIEEYIERTHDYMIGGDIFVLDGEVAFWGLMDSFRNKAVSEFIPVGTSFPSTISNEQFGRVSTLVQDVIDKLNIQSGPFNLEMMFGVDGELYMIEMNPRSGGNEIPEILKMATNVDLVEATIKAAMGEYDIQLKRKEECKFMSTYVLHSPKNGVLGKVCVEEEIQSCILGVKMHKKAGEIINKFDNAAQLVGVVLMEFSSAEEMHKCLGNISNLVYLSVRS